MPKPPNRLRRNLILVAVLAAAAAVVAVSVRMQQQARDQRIDSLQQERDALREDVDCLVQQVGERDRLLRGVRAQLEEQREQTARIAEVSR